MRELKSVAVILLVLILGVSYAQTNDLDEPRLFFVSMNVSDLDSSVVWYEKMLKLKTVDRAEYPEPGYRQANLKGNSLYLELIDHDSALAMTKVEEDHPGKKLLGITKIGLAVRNFNEWVGYLLMQEAKFIGGVTADRTTGKPMLTIADPDGNRIQIFEE